MKVLFKARKAVFLAALFSGVVAHGAHATTLVSPYVAVSFGDGVGCLIVNVGTKDITAKVELLKYDGTLLNVDFLDVAPGQARDINSSFVPGGYCRFSGDFSKKKVRASVNVLSASGGAVVSAE